MLQNQQLPEFLCNLILDQAIATVNYTPEERELFWQQIQSTETYQTWLRQQGVTSKQFESWMTRELTIRKFQQEKWGKKLSSYFLQRKYQMDRVICSLIYVKDRDVAQELYFRIAEGEQSFAEIARAHSEGAEAGAGGIIGPIELGKLNAKLARMLYGSYPGQLWEPTQIEEWIVIVRLEKWLPVQFDEFMRQHLLNELLEGWLQEQLKQRFPVQ